MTPDRATDQTPRFTVSNAVGNRSNEQPIQLIPTTADGVSKSVYDSKDFGKKVNGNNIASGDICSGCDT